jgi:putative two-component system response regulator
MALAHLSLGEQDHALKFARLSVRLSAEPKSHHAAIGRLVRELNLVMALVAGGCYGEAKIHSDYISHVASRYPSSRASAAAGLSAALVEIHIGDPQVGIDSLEKLAQGLKGRMVPLYIDSLSILLRAYSETERPDDALRVLRTLLSELRSAVSMSMSAQLQLLGIKHSTSPGSGSDNQREHTRRELELRARIAERDLANSRQELLERMAVASDIREDISGEHGYRVGRLSALLAREIGWDRDAYNALDIAARLHDIGKIGIPEKILLDEKTLREAEKHFIASHTTVGAEILSKSEIPQVRLAEEIARCHHEWWDGGGYPRNLKGASIPKSARIVALADAFDAMTHGRPYAAAISMSEALDRIAALRGSQFDPELTDHFLALVRRLASDNPDLDGYLGKAARNSPFLKARARIKEMLAQGRESSALTPSARQPGVSLN